MNLTPEQISQLYQFTKEHYVEWYDLQTELVDHLASEIEAIWNENPEISFEKARDISFKKFGIFGFGEIVEQKQKALYYQYWRSILKEFIAFFKLPKIILTLFFLFGTYYLFSFFNNGYFIFTLFALATGILPCYKTYNLYKRIKKRDKSTNKTWLLDATLFQFGFMPFASLCPFVNWFDIFYKKTFSTNQLLFLTLSFVTFNLLHYISFEIVIPKMQKKMREQFPEYKLEVK